MTRSQYHRAFFLRLWFRCKLYTGKLDQPLLISSLTKGVTKQMANTVTNPESTQTKTTWTLDPAHTSVEFSGKHLMVTTVRGHFGPVSGEIHLDESGYTKSSVEAAIDVANLYSREGKRDAHLRSA